MINYTDDPAVGARLMRSLPASVVDASIADAGNVLDGRRRFNARRPMRVSQEDMA